jgi:allophanate hydrolase subunit 2
VTVEPVLGSRSTDVLAGLGPPPLRAGDRLPVGPPPAAPVPAADVAAATAPSGDDVEVRAVLGPRADWFAPTAAGVLTATRWVASADSDRVGVRLDGATLDRARTDELPSEGMVAGALQVPPSGQPVLLLADAPTTGGYPVVAVLLAADVDRAAQLRPGQGLRIRLVPGRLPAG